MPGIDFSSLAIKLLDGIFFQRRLFLLHWKYDAWCSHLHELSCLDLLDNLLSLLYQHWLLQMYFRVLQLASFLKPPEPTCPSFNQSFLLHLPHLSYPWQHWRELEPWSGLYFGLRGCWAWFHFSLRTTHVFAGVALLIPFKYFSFNIHTLANCFV